MAAAGTGPSAFAKALKVGRASVLPALASWREHGRQAPIGSAVRGSSHGKEFIRRFLRKILVRDPTILSGGSQHSAGQWPGTAHASDDRGISDALTKFC